MDDARATRLRNDMVRTQVEARGIRHPLVLDAMRRLPRHRFVPPHLAEAAYDDRPLPIGLGQTISQPYMVARMLELLDPTSEMVVLDVGLGSGYQTGLLAGICRQVYAVERHCELAEKAHQVLGELGIHNVEVGCFDGSMGWPDKAPFDGIIVGAGAPQIPASLVDQLAEGGRLVIPVGTRMTQTVEVVEKKNGRIHRKQDVACRFVDLVGEQGWSER